MKSLAAAGAWIALGQHVLTLAGLAQFIRKVVAVNLQGAAGTDCDHACCAGDMDVGHRPGAVGLDDGVVHTAQVDTVDLAARFGCRRRNGHAGGKNEHMERFAGATRSAGCVMRAAVARTATNLALTGSKSKAKVLPRSSVRLATAGVEPV